MTRRSTSQKHAFTNRQLSGVTSISRLLLVCETSGGSVTLKAHHNKRGASDNAVASRLMSERINELEFRTKVLFFGFFVLCGVLLYVGIRLLFLFNSLVSK